MTQASKYLFFALCGFTIGYFLIKKEQIETIVTKTEFKTDTLYVTIRDTIRLTKTEIKQEYLRDTVLIDFKPQIKAFTASNRFLYGNISVSGEVLGEVLKMDISHDMKLPTITNTITKTNTIIKKPSGIFLTAGVNQTTPYVGGVFIRDKYLVGLNTSGFQVGYRLK